MSAAVRDPMPWGSAAAQAVAAMPTIRVLTSHPPASAPSVWETAASPADPGGTLPSPFLGRISAPAASRPAALCAPARTSFVSPAERPIVDAIAATTRAIPEMEALDCEPPMCDGCSTQTLPAAPDLEPWGAEADEGCSTQGGSTQTVAAWQPPVQACADAGACRGGSAAQGWVAAPTLVFGGAATEVGLLQKTEAGMAAGPLPIGTTAERPGFAALAGVHEQALVPTEVGAPLGRGTLRQLPWGTALGAPRLCAAAPGRQLSRQASSASTLGASVVVHQAFAGVPTTTICCVPGAVGATTSATRTTTSFVLQHNGQRVVVQAPALSECGPRRTGLELEPKTGQEEHDRIKQMARPTVFKKSKNLCC